MGLETVKTKVKEKFLHHERPWFPSMTDDEFKDFMVEDAVSCKNCGIWYWNECNKRCDCDN